jgi:hypothetical protein
MVVWLDRRRACNGEAEEVVGGGSGETYGVRLKMPAGSRSPANAPSPNTN